MTKEQLLFKIQTNSAWEFKYKNVTYNLTCEKDEKGSIYIDFGKLYEPQRFASFEDLMRNARVENSFFREMLENL